MEPDKLMNGISEEISAALNNMSQAKTPEEKLVHSQIVKNLCESIGVFLTLATEMSMYEDDDDIDLF